MIKLNQNSSNDVILTLREMTSISNPFYLFEFVSDDTNESKIFTASDVSTNKGRYNEFNIELTSGSEDLLNGVVKLPLKGFYHYHIYSQVSATNLDLSNITELVEIGKIYVNGNVRPEIEVYNQGNKTKTVYNG